MTTMNIINRFPIPVLEDKKPYQCLFEELPTYDHMRIFDCMAFTCNHSSTSDKIILMSVPCVFLGYPPFKKGYRLLNLFTMTTFISRDVKYCEHVFSFSSA